MNWYKKAQKEDITIDDIYWAMDDIWLNQIFTEEDIINILDSNLNNIVLSKEEPPEYLSRAAQVNTKNRPRNKNTGMPEFNYPKTKKKVMDEIKRQKKQMDLSQFINAKNIAQVIGTHPKIVDFIIKKHGIDLNQAMLERRKYAEKIIVDFVSSLPKKVPSIREAYNRFSKKYNHNIKIKKFNLILTYNNKVNQWSQKANNIFDAFNKYITQKYTNSRQNVDDLIANGKYLIILDRFLNEYGDKFGFKTPMDKEMAKDFFMTKIQLKERISQYRQLGQFYNQYLNPNMQTRVKELIEKGEMPQDISKQTGIALKQIEKFYKIYQLRHSPMITDENHPSYFLINPEKKNELV